MRVSRWLLLWIFLCAGALHGQSGWTPLWNGTDLDGWTTWMRQPEPGSDVPEGAEVFYRDIEIRPITAIPREFAAR